MLSWGRLVFKSLEGTALLVVLGIVLFGATDLWYDLVVSPTSRRSLLLGMGPRANSSEWGLLRTPENDARLTLTVAFFSRDRFEYLRSMPEWRDRLIRDLTRWPHEHRVRPHLVEMVLYDLGSSRPLSLPNFTRTNTPFKVGVRLVRVEGRSGGFNVWNAWATLLHDTRQYGPLHHVITLDNCNLPGKTGKFYHIISSASTKERKRDAWYFTNKERYYTGSIVVTREDLARLLASVPLRIAVDARSFVGSDQIAIWFLALAQYRHRNEHMTHLSVAQVDHVTIRSTAVWRMWLTMNYMSTPVHGNDYRDDEDLARSRWCRDKAILCAWNGTVPALLRLPAVFHVVDLFSRMTWLMLPCVWLSRLTDNVSLGFVLGSLLVAALTLFAGFSLATKILPRLLSLPSILGRTVGFLSPHSD